MSIFEGELGAMNGSITVLDLKEKKWWII